MCAGRPTSAMPKPRFLCSRPSAVLSGGGVFVVAGCVSVVCRWWWCKNHVMWCGEMWCNDKWWDVIWCGDRCWDVMPAIQRTTPRHMKRPVHCAEQPMGCKTQWNYDIHVWCSQHMKTSSTMRAATGVTFQHPQIFRAPTKRHPTTTTTTTTAAAAATTHHQHQLLRRLPQKLTLWCVKQIEWGVIYNGGWFDHDATMKLQNSVPRAYTFPLNNAFCIEKNNISRSDVAPGAKSDPPTSPNVVPGLNGTKSDTPTSHIVRLAITKLCACHEQWLSNITVRLLRKVTFQHRRLEKWLSWLILVTYETSIYIAQSNRTPPPHVAPATKCEMWRMCDVSEVSVIVLSVMRVMCDVFHASGVSHVIHVRCEWCEWCVTWVMWVVCDVRCGWCGEMWWC